MSEQEQNKKLGELTAEEVNIRITFYEENRRKKLYKNG